MNKGLKRTARRKRDGGRLRIIGTHHTNRNRSKKGYNPTKEQGDAQDVAMGESLLRYVDGLVRVYMTPQHRDNQELAMDVKKMREGKLPCRYTCNAMPAVDFSQKRVDEDEPFSEGAEDEDTL